MFSICSTSSSTVLGSPTEARRISFEDMLRFERTHEETYRGLGFELVFVEPASVAERVNAIKAAIA